MKSIFSFWGGILCLLLACMLTAQEPVDADDDGAISRVDVHPAKSVSFQIEVAEANDTLEKQYLPGGSSCPPLGAGRVDLDLVQQCRMAVASERVVWLTTIGIIVSSLGFLFLWLTIRAQNKNTEALIMAERALLNIKDVELHDSKAAILWARSRFQPMLTHYRLNNCGKTAANDIMVDVCRVILDRETLLRNVPNMDDPMKEALEQLPSVSTRAALSTVIESGDTESTYVPLELPKKQVNEILSRDSHFYMYGKIIFSDVFGKRRSIGFGYKFDAYPIRSYEQEFSKNGKLRKLGDPNFWKSEQ